MGKSTNRQTGRPAIDTPISGKIDKQKNSQTDNRGNKRCPETWEEGNCFEKKKTDREKIPIGHKDKNINTFTHH